jgi:hypothetical protein
MEEIIEENPDGQAVPSNSSNGEIGESIHVVSDSAIAPIVSIIPIPIVLNAPIPPNIYIVPNNLPVPALVPDPNIAPYSVIVQQEIQEEIEEASQPGSAPASSSLIVEDIKIIE